MSDKLKAALVMGSDSDFPVLKRSIRLLKAFGVETEVHVISAHRTPYQAEEFASKAESAGIGVIIAAAGKAAHLAGVIASYTILPVIGLPVKSSTMDGLDSLLSMVQMPKGIPVATVAIDGLRMLHFGVQILSPVARNRVKTRSTEWTWQKRVEKDRLIREEVENYEPERNEE